MKKRYGVELDLKKPFGPRTATGAVKEGAEKPLNGTDIRFDDHNIMRFLIAREWKMDAICKDIHDHL